METTNVPSLTGIAVNYPLMPVIFIHASSIPEFFSEVNPPCARPGLG